MLHWFKVSHIDLWVTNLANLSKGTRWKLYKVLKFSLNRVTKCKPTYSSCLVAQSWRSSYCLVPSMSLHNTIQDEVKKPYWSSTLQWRGYIVFPTIYHMALSFLFFTFTLGRNLLWCSWHLINNGNIKKRTANFTKYIATQADRFSISSKRLNQWTTKVVKVKLTPSPSSTCPGLTTTSAQSWKRGELTEISALKSKAAFLAGHHEGVGWCGVGHGAICSIGQVASLLPSASVQEENALRSFKNN